MTSKPDKKLIGAFVLIAFILFFGTFFMIKRDVLTTRTVKYVMYFDGSVKGLSVGAPVVFNGVPIGRVAGISLTANLQNLSFQIPVTIDINADSFSTREKKTSLWHMEFYHRKSQIEIFHQLIEKGLRARLIMQSFLTGQMMIELSFSPDTPIILRGNTELPEIPTLPSSFAELSRTVQNLPIHQIVTNMNTTLTQLNALLTAINRDAPETLANLSAISKNITTLTDPNSQTIIDINRFLKDASYAAQSLRNWADYLERHPEALLKGKGNR